MFGPLKKFKLSVYKKNIAKISFGTIAGHGISIVTLPIIVRVYGPGIMGIWALITSISAIINAISDLGLTNSIMVESEEDNERTYKVITTLSAVICIIGSLLSTVIYFSMTNDNMNVLAFFIIISLISFMLQQIQICYTWLNRNSKYNVLMKNPILHNGTYSILAIVLGVLGMATYGYFIAHIIGKFITLLSMKRNLPRIMFTYKISDFKDVLSKNKKFLYYQLPTNLIGKVKGELPVFLIRSFWGVETLGYYSISLRLLHMPTNLLSSAIGRVFFQRTSELKRQGKDIGQFVYRTMNQSMKIGLVPLILLIAFGDIITTLVLGDEWRIAGDFLRILGLLYFFIFVINSVQGLAITLDKQNYAMISIFLQAISYVISLSVGKFLFDNIYVALMLMSIMVILIRIIYYCMLCKVMEISWRKYVRSISISIIAILVISSLLRAIVNYSGLLDQII